jgi:hypothetical protein
MARARTIKPQFLESRSMRAVSAMARLTFIQLWLLADDAGRLVVYSTLARRLFPGDAEAVALFPGWLDELEAQRCIERYTVEGWPYLRIVNWDRHQKIYHPTPSRLPPRPAGFRKESGAIREALGSEIKKPSRDKTLTPGARIPERFASLASRSGKNVQVPVLPDSSADFTSDSRGEGFFRRAAALVRWNRPRPTRAVIPNAVRDP